MKKIILLLLLGVFFSITSFSQVTFEHSYTTNGNNNFPKTYAFFTDSGINYYTMDQDLNQVLFYNSSHILFKTVNLNPGTDFNIKYIYLVTDKLFYSDAKIEFIVVSSNSLYQNKMTLFNEDGTNLLEFGDRWEAYAVKNSNLGYKLIVATDKEEPNFYDIYSLTGTLSLDQQGVLSKTQFFSFPNPTSNKISFTTDLENGNTTNLEIFDINGKKVLEKNMTVIENKIEIDVTNLNSGIYIYKLNGRSNKFIKE
jgi:hypothetical protein